MDQPRRRMFYQGISIVELLIVVAILGLMAFITIASLKPASVNSKLTKTENNMHVLTEAIYHYYVDHGVYPPAYPPNTTETTFVPALTTPVAYITSLDQARDPFKKGSYLWVGNYAKWPGTPLPGEKIYAWGVVSAGPNGIHDGLRNEPYFTAGRNPSRVDTIYDPTNGLTSYGDIGQFGGEAQTSARESIAE
jgi:type II secretory pathway pseudopilin PulG